MPTYEYKAIEGGCRYCQEGFETRESIRAKPLRKCPECGAEVRRVIGSFQHYTARPRFSYERAASAGFTSYERSESGLKKIAGPGPDLPTDDVSKLP